MNEKLNVLTHYNGSRIRDAFFRMLLIMFVFTLALLVALHYGLNLSFSSLFSMLLIVLIGPFIIFLIIVPAYVFNEDFYRKNRYYMISIKSLYKYYLEEIYSLKNIALIVIGTSVLLTVLSAISNPIEISFVLSIFSTYLLTPIVASGLFLLTTYFGTVKWFLQTITYISVYVFMMISVFIISEGNPLIVFIVLIVLNIICYFVTVRLTHRIESNMEV